MGLVRPRACTPRRVRSGPPRQCSAGRRRARSGEGNRPGGPRSSALDGARLRRPESCPRTRSSPCRTGFAPSCSTRTCCSGCSRTTRGGVAISFDESEPRSSTRSCSSIVLRKRANGMSVCISDPQVVAAIERRYRPRALVDGRWVYAPERRDHSVHTLVEWYAVGYPAVTT